MLGNGLGEALERSLAAAERVLDPFTGSAAVAWHVAERFGKEVLAGDLQMYSAALAASVIERTSPITDRIWVERWISQARERIMGHPNWGKVEKHQLLLGSQSVQVASATAHSIQYEEDFVISKAYGGYYFSPWQSLWIDALRASLPETENEKKVALAALIQASSRCAASPGHTAQPFKPNDTAGKYLLDAWQKDIVSIVRARIEDIAPRSSVKMGKAYCMDAAELIQNARRGDLVFLDPPYSGVQYSRFYHVLESIARGQVGEVSGAGRYPELSMRPTSEFSLVTASRRALDKLLAVLAEKRAKVIITFPAGRASNGLTGEDVKDLAANHFQIEEAKVSSRFSTLGGDLKHRAARQHADELILTLSEGAAN